MIVLRGNIEPSQTGVLVLYFMCYKYVVKEDANGTRIESSEFSDMFSSIWKKYEEKTENFDIGLEEKLRKHIRAAHDNYVEVIERLCGDKNVNSEKFRSTIDKLQKTLKRKWRANNIDEAILNDNATCLNYVSQYIMNPDVDIFLKSDLKVRMVSFGSKPNDHVAHIVEPFLDLKTYVDDIVNNIELYNDIMFGGIESNVLKELVLKALRHYGVENANYLDSKYCNECYWTVKPDVERVRIEDVRNAYLLDADSGMLNYVYDGDNGFIKRSYAANTVSIFKIDDVNERFKNVNKKTATLDESSVGVFYDKTPFSFYVVMSNFFEKTKTAEPTSDDIIMMVEDETDTNASIIGKLYRFCEEIETIEQNRNVSRVDCERYVASLQRKHESTMFDRGREFTRSPNSRWIEESVNLSKKIVKSMYLSKNTSYIEAVLLKMMGSYDARMFHIEFDSPDFRDSREKLRRFFMNDRLYCVFKLKDECLVAEAMNERDKREKYKTAYFPKMNDVFDAYLECVFYRATSIVQHVCENSNKSYMARLLLKTIKHRSEFIDLECFDPMIFANAKHDDFSKKTTDSTTFKPKTKWTDVDEDDGEYPVLKFEKFLREDLLSCENTTIPSDLMVVLIVSMMVKMGDFKNNRDSEREYGVECLYRVIMEILVRESHVNVSTSYPRDCDFIFEKKTPGESVDFYSTMDMDERVENNIIAHFTHTKLKMRLYDVFGTEMYHVHEGESITNGAALETYMTTLMSGTYEPIASIKERHDFVFNHAPNPSMLDENMLTTNSYDDIMYCSSRLFVLKYFTNYKDNVAFCDIQYAVRMLLNAWCQTCKFDTNNIEKTYREDISSKIGGDVEPRIVEDSIDFSDRNAAAMRDDSNALYALSDGFSGFFDADNNSAEFDKRAEEVRSIFMTDIAKEPDAAIEKIMSLAIAKDDPVGKTDASIFVSDDVYELEPYRKLLEEKSKVKNDIHFGLTDDRLIYAKLDDFDDEWKTYLKKSAEHIVENDHKTNISTTWQNRYWLTFNLPIYKHLVKPTFDWISPIARLANVFWNAYAFEGEETDANSANNRDAIDRREKHKKYVYDELTFDLLNVSLVKYKRIKSKIYEKKSDENYTHSILSKPKTNALAKYFESKMHVNIVRVLSEIFKHYDGTNHVLPRRGPLFIKRKMNETDWCKTNYDTYGFPRTFKIYEDSWFDSLPISLTVDSSFGDYFFHQLGIEKCKYISSFFEELCHKYGLYEIPMQYHWRHYVRSDAKKNMTFDAFLKRMRLSNRDNENASDDKIDRDDAYVLKNTQYMFDALIGEQNPRCSMGVRKSSFLKTLKFDDVTGLDAYFPLENYKKNPKYAVLHYFFKFVRIVSNGKTNDSEESRMISAELKSIYVAKSELKQILSENKRPINFSENSKNRYFNIVSSEDDVGREFHKYDILKTNDRLLRQHIGHYYDLDMDSPYKMKITDPAGYEKYRHIGNAFLFDEGNYMRNNVNKLEYIDVMDVYTLMKHLKEFEPIILHCGKNDSDTYSYEYIKTHHVNLLAIVNEYLKKRYEYFSTFDTIIELFKMSLVTNVVFVVSANLNFSRFENFVLNIVKNIDVAFKTIDSKKSTLAERLSTSLSSASSGEMLDNFELVDVSIFLKCFANDSFSPYFYLIRKNDDALGDERSHRSKSVGSGKTTSSIAEHKIAEPSSIFSNFLSFATPFISQTNERSFLSSVSMSKILGSASSSSLDFKIKKDKIPTFYTRSMRGVRFTKSPKAGEIEKAVIYDDFYDFRRKIARFDDARSVMVDLENVKLSFALGHVKKIACENEPLTYDDRLQVVKNDALGYDYVYGDRFAMWTRFFSYLETSNECGNVLKFEIKKIQINRVKTRRTDLTSIHSNETRDPTEIISNCFLFNISYKRDRYKGSKKTINDEERFGASEAFEKYYGRSTERVTPHSNYDTVSVHIAAVNENYKEAFGWSNCISMAPIFDLSKSNAIYLQIPTDVRFLLNLKGVLFVPNVNKPYTYDVQKIEDENDAYREKSGRAKSKADPVGKDDERSSSGEPTQKRRKTNASIADKSPSGDRKVTSSNVGSTDKYRVIFNDVRSSIQSSASFSKIKTAACKDLMQKVFSTYYRRINVEYLKTSGESYDNAPTAATMVLSERDVVVLRSKRACDALLRDVLEKDNALLKEYRQFEADDSRPSSKQNIELLLLEKVNASFKSKGKLKRAFYAFEFRSFLPKVKIANAKKIVGKYGEEVANNYKKIRTAYELVLSNAISKCKSKMLMGVDVDTYAECGNVHFRSQLNISYDPEKRTDVSSIDEYVDHPIVVPISYAILPYLEYIMSTHAIVVNDAGVEPSSTASIDAISRENVYCSDVFDYDGLFCNYEDRQKKGRRQKNKKDEDRSPVQLRSNVVVPFEKYFCLEGLKKSGLNATFTELYEDVLYSETCDVSKKTELVRILSENTRDLAESPENTAQYYYDAVREEDKSSRSHNTETSPFDDLYKIGIPVHDFSFGVAKATLSNKYNACAFMYSRLFVEDKKKNRSWSYVSSFVSGWWMRDVLPYLFDRSKQLKKNGATNVFKMFHVRRDTNADDFNLHVYSNVLYESEYKILIFGLILIHISKTFSDHMYNVCRNHAHIVLDDNAVSILDSYYHGRDGGAIGSKKEETTIADRLSDLFDFDDDQEKVEPDGDAVAHFRDMFGRYGSSVVSEERDDYEFLGSDGNNIVNIAEQLHRGLLKPSKNIAGPIGTKISKTLTKILKTFLGRFGNFAPDESFELYLLYLMTKLINNTMFLGRASIEHDVEKTEDAETHFFELSGALRSALAPVKMAFSDRFCYSGDSIGMLQYRLESSRGSKSYAFRWCDVYDDPNLTQFKRRCIRKIVEKRRGMTEDSDYKTIDLLSDCSLENIRTDSSDFFTKDVYDAFDSELDDSYDALKHLVAKIVNDSYHFMYKERYMQNDFVKSFFDMHRSDDMQHDVSKKMTVTDKIVALIRHIEQNTSYRASVELNKTNAVRLNNVICMLISMCMISKTYMTEKTRRLMILKYEKMINSNRISHSKYLKDEKCDKILGLDGFKNLIFSNAYFDANTVSNYDSFFDRIGHEVKLYKYSKTPSAFSNVRYITDGSVYGISTLSRDEILNDIIVYSNVPLAMWSSFCNTYKNRWDRRIVVRGMSSDDVFEQTAITFDRLYDYQIFIILSNVYPYVFECVLHDDNDGDDVPEDGSIFDRFMYSRSNVTKKTVIEGGNDSILSPIFNQIDNPMVIPTRSEEGDRMTVKINDVLGFRRVVLDLANRVSDIKKSTPTLDAVDKNIEKMRDFVRSSLVKSKTTWNGFIEYGYYIKTHPSTPDEHSWIGGRKKKRDESALMDVEGDDATNKIFIISKMNVGTRYSNDSVIKSEHRTLKPHQLDCVEQMIAKRGIDLEPKTKLVPVVLPVGGGKTTVLMSYLDRLMKVGVLSPYAIYVTESDAIPSLLKEFWFFGVRVNIIRPTSESSNMNARIAKFVNELLSDSDARYYERDVHSVAYSAYDNKIISVKKKYDDGYGVLDGKMDVESQILARIMVNGNPLELTSSVNGRGIKTSPYESNSINHEIRNFLPFCINVVDYNGINNISDEVFLRLSRVAFDKDEVLNYKYSNEDSNLVALIRGFMYSETKDKENKTEFPKFSNYFGSSGYAVVFDEYHSIMRSDKSNKRDKIFTLLRMSKDAVGMSGTPFTNKKSMILSIPFLSYSVPFPLAEHNMYLAVNDMINANVVSKFKKSYYVHHVKHDTTTKGSSDLLNWRKYLDETIEKSVAFANVKNIQELKTHLMLQIEKNEYKTLCRIEKRDIKNRSNDSIFYLIDVESDGQRRKELRYDMSREDNRLASDTITQLRQKTFQTLYRSVYAEMLCLAINLVKNGKCVMMYVKYIDHLKIVEELLDDYLKNWSENEKYYDDDDHQYRIVVKDDIDMARPLDMDKRLTFAISEKSFDYVYSDVDRKRIGLIVLPFNQRRGFNMTGCSAQLLTFFNGNVGELEQANGRIDRIDQVSDEISYYYVFNDRLCLEYLTTIQFPNLL